jgi:WD40 repeat protein
MGLKDIRTSMIDYLDILLGTGGNSPGLEAYGAISGNSEKILSLQRGQSVYAVDVSPDGNAIAAATKSGDIYLLAPAEGEPERCVYSVRHSASGAPVLSVCFVDASMLAVADTVGGCLLRNAEADTQPTQLRTGDRVICSLFHLDSKCLAGLSLSGRLLIWDVAERGLVRVLEVPGPPHDLSALVIPHFSQL